MDRSTTSKERFIGRAASRHPHQILRVDREHRTPISCEFEDQLSDFVDRRIADCQAVLISDYDKGVCTARFLTHIVDAAAERGIPVLVDPARIQDYSSRYCGAHILVPNRREAELATGIRIESSEDAFEAACRIRQFCDVQAVIVKLDRDGMVLVQPDGQEKSFVARPRSVYDVTGAGDMVLAMLGLCLASGIDLSPAIELANTAAGLEVEKLGVVPVVSAPKQLRELGGSWLGSSSKVVTIDQLEGLAGRLSAEGPDDRVYKRLF